MASAPWGVGGRREGFGSRLPWLGKAAEHLLNCTVEFALQPKKSMENLSQGSRVVTDYSLRRLSCPLRDSFGWPADDQSTRVTRGELQSSLGRHKYLLSCGTKGFPAFAELWIETLSQCSDVVGENEVYSGPPLIATEGSLFPAIHRKARATDVRLAQRQWPTVRLY
jgi:hypothetical protein